jgi:hypothetical protein
MNTINYKLFSKLCESVLIEASTTMNILTGVPGANTLIGYLHKSEELAHDQNFQSIPAIQWKDYKKDPSWILIVYGNGVAAISTSGRGSYEAYAVDSSTSPPEVKRRETASSGDAMAFIKQHLSGRIKNILVGKKNATLYNKRDQRRIRNLQLAKTKTLNSEQILFKFKPLWLRTIDNAIADIKGWIGTLVQNNNYTKAKEKLSYVGELSTIKHALEDNKSDSLQDSSNYRQLDFLKRAVGNAVAMAAYHYYPQETAGLSTGYNGAIVPRNANGIDKLVDDIANGDTKKLGTVLGFFKKVLITG